ncbi:lysine methyltransferase [Fragilaria crotonensis]|nr:lysine methyltransferase [Fragilaria crotonensis]
MSYSNEESKYIVLLQVEENGDDQNVGGTTTPTTLKLKLQIRTDSHEKEGTEIVSAILRHVNVTSTDQAVAAVVQVYDPESHTFVSLADQSNVATKFGKRLRCILHRQTHQKQNGPLLAIAGRYYPYDNGMMIMTENNTHHRLEAWEMPNIPGAGTGLNVWDGAILLAKYLELNPEVVKGNCVLELGAGCGVVGIAACMLGAERAILTDLPYAMELMKANVAKNEASVKAADCRVCDWCTPPEFHVGDTWTLCNVLLIADCVWIDELVEPLLNTISSFLDSSHGVVKAIVSYQRRGNSAHDLFWPGMRRLFDNVEKIVVQIDKPANLDIYVCHVHCPRKMVQNAAW